MNTNTPNMQDSLYRVMYAGHDGWLPAEPSTLLIIYTSVEAAEEYIMAVGKPAYDDGTPITYALVEYVLPPF